MARLVVNPGTPESWEVELKPGVTSLGRSEQNDLTIAHESVSSAHCQITVAPTGVWLKDLGSTGGTFIDGELIEEAQLKPNQDIRLGEVQLRLELDPGETTLATSAPMHPPLRATPNPLPPLAAGRRFCKYHPRAVARFACPQCRRMFCELCVNTRHETNRTLKLCRTCGSECQALHVGPAAPEPELSFFRSIPGAFAYPFNGSGAILLVAGTVFFLITDYLPLLGLILTGYLFSYAKRIITSTAEGASEPPDWPDFGSWFEDIILPYLQFLALVVLAFGPAIVVAVWSPADAPTAHVVLWAALAFGALMAPMAMLGLAMFNNFTVLNPVALAWSIQRVPLQYLVAAAMFEIVLALKLLAGGFVARLLPLPLLPAIVSGLLNLYFLTVGMRILGLLYVCNKQQLAWFRH
jgi:pSer/pThr/pTyr-binding forkhead associated (FHA) protein